MPATSDAETDDQTLIESYLRGDSEAVAAVDEWLRRAASSYRRRLRDSWDDVLQDVRLEVTRLLRQGKFRGESSLKTYLWRVTGHTCLDRLRSRQRARIVEIDSEITEADHLEEMAAAPRGWNAERDLLLRVLARMDEDCRRLWGMLIEGRSYREMSDETGITEGALRVRVLRCRKRAHEVRADLLATE
jgi:RNA polymerase sigma factor (sigma-70 family)